MLQVSVAMFVKEVAATPNQAPLQHKQSYWPSFANFLSLAICLNKSFLG
jgi:hypothetical protein